MRGVMGEGGGSAFLQKLFWATLLQCPRTGRPLQPGGVGCGRGPSLGIRPQRQVPIPEFEGEAWPLCKKALLGAWRLLTPRQEEGDFDPRGCVGEHGESSILWKFQPQPLHNLGESRMGRQQRAQGKALCPAWTLSVFGWK